LFIKLIILSFGFTDIKKLNHNCSEFSGRFGNINFVAYFKLHRKSFTTNIAFTSIALTISATVSKEY
jgi:hypothetical protein